MDEELFSQWVRDALCHLYDPPYLEQHPLRLVLLPGMAPEAKGPTLFRRLLDGIESLRPPEQVPRAAARWRPYLILCARFVDGQDPAAVAQELAISPRQYRREQARGLRALTELLWKSRPTAPSAAGATTRTLLEAEAARLGSTPSVASSSLAETVQGALTTLAAVAQSRQLALAPALPPGLPPVAVDRVVLRQVLLNVLGHAIECGANGSIDLSARAIGFRIEVTVQSRVQGHHLPEAEAELDRLALAASLLASQGGELHLDPSQHAVRLRLPARQLPLVLVIDDNPDVIQLFQRYLAGGAWRVVGASDGREALRLAQELRPVAITLDVMMPELDGWELLQTLKNLPATASVPVIVCSVLREETLALSLGAAAFVAKPATQEKLLAALAQCLAPADHGEHRDQPAGSA